jgi:hypothetical protein
VTSVVETGEEDVIPDFGHPERSDGEHREGYAAPLARVEGQWAGIAAAGAQRRQD